MAGSVESICWDAIVIGSGAGGATVARELTRAGQRVLLLEKGLHHKWLGNAVAAARFIDRLGMRRSREGLAIIRALTTGGTTLIYGACAARPPAWMHDEYGIDLDDIVNGIEKELNICPTPEHLMGTGSQVIRDAANQLGIEWHNFPKFVDFKKCRTGCGNCMTGCRYGAKWTARAFIKEALAQNGRILTGFNALKVTRVNGRATGVYGKYRNNYIALSGKKIILAAGGLETPAILLRSGIKEAGRNFFCDPMAFVYGALNKPKPVCDIPNTAGSFKFHDQDGIFLADHSDPVLFYPMQLITQGPAHLPKWLKYKSTIGILIKIKDTPGGQIYPDGSFSKALSREDMAKLDKGTKIATRILQNAGAVPSSMINTAVRGAHPGGTAALGQVVDHNLETAIKELYVCDASVLPKAMASPQVLTIMALAQRLASHLLVRCSGISPT